MNEDKGGAINAGGARPGPLFTDDEIAVLENHGYCLADAALKGYVSELHDSDSRTRLPIRAATIADSNLAGSDQIIFFGHH